MPNTLTTSRDRALPSLRLTPRQATRVAMSYVLTVAVGAIALGLAGYRLTPPTAPAAAYYEKRTMPQQPSAPNAPPAYVPPDAATGWPRVMTSLDAEAEHYDVVIDTDSGPARLTGVLWAEAGRRATVLAVDDTGNYLPTREVDPASGTRLASVTVYGAISIRPNETTEGLPAVGLTPDGGIVLLARGGDRNNP